MNETLNSNREEKWLVSVLDLLFVLFAQHAVRITYHIKAGMHKIKAVVLFQAFTHFVLLLLTLNYSVL